MTKLAGNYPSRSRNGKFELKIVNQPEEQHRARYLTEGSRGSIKDISGLGHPVVKLYGFNGCPVRLQCFIGHDKNFGVPHLFYQASRITGKNSTRCSTTKIEGIAVISMDLTPENNMQATIDCIGILKERNVDVEQKVLRLKTLNAYNNGEAVNFPNKKRCAKCRLVFRCKIPGTNEILQAVSTPILCTQPVGTPEICKMSLTECKVNGGQELYIIGKNFLKDSKVIFKNENWCKIIEPDKEYLHSSHLICNVPSFDGPNSDLPGFFNVSISIRSGGKYSDSHTFTFINDSKAISMPIQRSLPSNTQGSNHAMLHKQLLSFGRQTCDGSKIEDDHLKTQRNGKSQSNLSLQMDINRYFSEDSVLSSDSSTISEAMLVSEDSCFQDQSTILSTSHSSNSIDMMTNFLGRISNSPIVNNSSSNESPFDGRRSNGYFNNREVNNQLTNSLTTTAATGGDLMDSQSQQIIEMNSIPTPIKSEQDLFAISPLPIIPNCESSPLTANTQSDLTPSQLMPPPPIPSLHLLKDEKVSPPPTTTSNQLLPNGTLTSNPSRVNAAPTVMQASQINAMSQMSENELIRFINPSAFEDFKEDGALFNYACTN